MESLYYCSQYYIYSASDFKSVVQGLLRNQQPVTAVINANTSNPLTAPVQQKANSQPGKSKLVDYDIIFN